LNPGLLSLLQDSPALLGTVALVLGLLVGSFLNVVIYRLPIMLEREWQAQAEPLATEAAPEAPAAGAVAKFNLIEPRSCCPSCKRPIKAYQNIPIISFLLLRGRCAHCKTPISWRYPAIEALTGILSAVAALHFGANASGALAVVVTWFLIAMTFIDLDTQLLPDALTLPLLWIALLASATFPTTAGLNLPVDPVSAILGAVAGYLSLWCFYQLFRLITGKEGMGYGDFKLLAALCALLGYKMLLPIILFAALSGAVIGVGLIVARRHGRSVPIPFGPFLAIAGYLAMLWGPQWVDAYFGLYGHR
jgi:leader peptidase (prepilin peptidase) / N-methyltransferase